MKDTPRRRYTPVIITGGTLILALWIAYVFRVVVGPLLLAAALAYILEPLVRWLVRRGWKRPVAVTSIMLAGLLLGLSMLGAVAAGTVQFVSELQGEGRVFRGVEAFFAWAKDAADDAPPWVGEGLQSLTEPAMWKGPIERLLSIALEGLSGLMDALSLLGVLILLPVYLFYLMLELDKIWDWVRSHLPKYDREHTLGVLSRLNYGMTAFLRGRVVLALLKGIVIAVGLMFCGTPLALVVGLGAGALSVLPFVGPALGFVVAMALTLAESVTIGGVVGVCAVFAVAEVLENIVLMPLAMPKGADLHPLLLLFSVIFWGAVLGLFGALVAIPMTLVIKVLLEEYVMPSVREVAGVEAPVEGPAGPSPPG